VSYGGIGVSSANVPWDCRYRGSARGSVHFHAPSRSHSELAGERASGQASEHSGRVIGRYERSRSAVKRTVGRIDERTGSSVMRFGSRRGMMGTGDNRAAPC